MSGKQFCEKCLITTKSFKTFQKHLLTKKHQSDSSIELRYNCAHCIKTYKSREGLWKHSKICFEILSTATNIPLLQKEDLIQEIKNSIIHDLKRETSVESTLAELKNDNIELKKLIIGLTQNTNITNNDNSTNNTFNINVFLNEKCGNAINLDDFIKNLVFEFGNVTKMMEDYVEGSLSILKKNMEQIPLNKRPMHYLEGEDKNQQLIHIRQNDKWKTETEINWIRQINADDDDVLEKQTLYFALKQLDDKKLEYLRYNFYNDEKYKDNHRRLNSEIFNTDKKMKLFEEIMKMITFTPNSEK